ncbi:MAG: carbohydrate binding domain-containing protein [Armatimonadota bacterium]
MNMLSLVATMIVLGLLASANAPAQENPLDPARVAEIAGMLPEAPEGLGRPAADREAWDALAGTDAYANVIRKAEGLLDEPLPEQPDELYLDFSETGNRTRWQRVANQRRGRLAPLVLAECAENEGRFIPAIVELVEALCAERTWVMPAHDRSLANFNQERVDIDLASSSVGWQMATVNWLLGDKLSDETRDLIALSVSERVLEPYQAMYTGEREPNWWMNTTNNWNAVCLAGVTGAALAQIEDRALRGEYVAAAEHYSRNFLRGFTADGYCSEGLGYWNYGFGNYILLAETIYQATDGGVDMMARPEVAPPATFATRIQIIGGVAPAFADCSINARPGSDWMYYLNRRFGLGLDHYDDLPLSSTTGSLINALIFGFPNSASSGDVIEGADPGSPLRAWFEDAGVLISRPAPGSEALLGVALKGGHNAEHHNHNDVGSYVAVVEDRPVLMDPGSEVYTSRTFSGQRYESNLLNSWGHPVPVVAGELQRTGRDAAAVVLASDFADERDSLTLDLSAAYDVPELTKLERAFVYERQGDGSLTVTDTVTFSEPRDFETALITDGNWERQDAETLLVSDGNRAAQVRLETGGLDWELVVDEIEEDARAQPTRLGIRLTEPVSEATITATIAPVPGYGLKGDSVLFNGDFELGGQGWTVGGGSLGEISAEEAASGDHSLKIIDETDGTGSNVTSGRMTVDGGGAWLLRGKVRHVSGSGIGMYVRFYDAAGRGLNESDGRGNISPVGSLEGEVGEWVPFEFAFETPEDTARMDLWIHSYNASEVVAYIDELEIVPAE